MNKWQYCESRESIAYYSGLNGLEIKGIEYGINDYVYCVSGCWYGGKAAILYPPIRYKRLYVMKHGRKGLQIVFVISR